MRMTKTVKTAPKISVLMSVYNGEPYLREAIESILKQTFKDFEFIIINDGSTDASQETIDSFTDRRLVVIQQENIGLTRSLNKGISIARGEYIARQDADDISLLDRFEKQVAYLEAHHEVAVLGGAIIQIDEDGNAIRKSVYPQTHDEIKSQLFKGICPIVHTTVMFRKQEIESLGKYSEIFYCEDYELWLRVSQKFQLGTLGDVLAHLRLQSGSLSQLPGERLGDKWLALEVAIEEERSGIYFPDSPGWKDFLVDFTERYELVGKAYERHFRANQALRLCQVSWANGNYLRAISLAFQSMCTWPRGLFSVPKRLTQYFRSCRLP